MPATDEFWRSLPRMHRWFAVSAVLVLATTLLMMYVDETRTWKKVQVQAEEYRVERLDRELAKLENPAYEQALSEAQANKETAEKAHAGRAAELVDLERRLSELQGQVQILARNSKFQNADRDKARADYDLAVRDQRPPEKLAELFEEFEHQNELARQKALASEEAQTRFSELRSQWQAKRADLDAALADWNKARADQQTLEDQRKQLRPTNKFVALKRELKEWPIINAFNPIHKIQYDWARDLQQQLGMARVSRVDRCRTCHVNIADFGAGNVPNYPCSEFPQPYCSHPNPDVFLAGSSPHPMTSFGCTICHEGDGSGTSFQTAEHSPPNPAVAAHWAQDHHWHENHFWEYPMFPKQFIESSCLKCHHHVVELGINDQYGATAPTLYKGYSLIRDFGCFGCHEINGYDGTTPIGPDMRLEPQTPEEADKYATDPNLVAGKMRKVGPSLRHINTKTTREFIAYWTAEPKRFRPTTRMPQFFGQSNQEDATAEAFQPVELAAIAEYLHDKSEPLELQAPVEGYQRNPDRGRQLFSKRGCLACHSRSGEEFAEIHANFGPDLSRVHEKLKPGEEGFRWLYTWLKQPTHYHPRTKMPNLFLDPYEEGGQQIDPAADVAAYLLQGGPTQFPPLVQATPYLGIAIDPDFSLAKAQALGIAAQDYRGVLVNEVIKGSPAERAEVQYAEGMWLPAPLAANDVMISIGGQPLTSPDRLSEIELRSRPNETLEADVLVTTSRSIASSTGESYQLKGVQRYKFRLSTSTPLDDLVRLFLSKSMTKTRVARVFETRRYPVTADMYAEGKSLSNFIKGDEIELAPLAFDEQVSDQVWEHRKQVYIGRRTISRYGCYGCHDIPNFEAARPIGTALQDWGRKDTSKLAYEHIHEFLEHHGEPDGSSTAARLERVVKDEYNNPGANPEQTLVEASLYKSAISHGRAGFLWQKLRDPRSYDDHKTETKGWDERLRMPKFPFTQTDIEAVATFVLGLVADPPPPAYQYRPSGPPLAKIEGERLLTKYNCTGCHFLEIPVWEFGINPDELIVQELSPEDRATYQRLQHVKPPRPGWTGQKLPSGEPILRASGYPQQFPDPEEELEFQVYSFVSWDPIDLGDGRRMMPGQPIPIGVQKVHSQGAGRGGDLAKWLIPRLPKMDPAVKDINEAWQASPPPLDREGVKVQTPWLFQFLKNPEQLRYTTVLRMPRFNMSDQEAQTLADYFAAKNGALYPYQSVLPREAEYQREQQAEYREEYPHSEYDYLTASWLVLNGPLCRKCHSVGGNVLTTVDPKEVKRGPNLQRVERRIRPEFAELWIYNPKWVLPYTSMPQNFPAGSKSGMPDLFNGNNVRQAEAVVDALFNYTSLMEAHGPTTYDPPDTPAAGGTTQRSSPVGSSLAGGAK